MGFDCVICSKLLEEEPDPPTDPTNSKSSQVVPIPSKRSRNVIVNGQSTSTTKTAKQQSNATELIVVTHCGHLFHKVCVSQWINKSGSCPVCREICSLVQLQTIYPGINTDKEVQLQESMDKCLNLDSQLSKLKCTEVELNSKVSLLESALTESKNSSSILLTSMNLINKKCMEQESELQNLRKELEKLQIQAYSDSLKLLTHFTNGECKFEVQVQQILNKLNKNAQQQQIDDGEARQLSIQAPKPSTSKSSTSSSSSSIGGIGRLKLSQLTPIRIPKAPSLFRLSPPPVIPPQPQPPLLDFNGEYELKTSKNFKHYLEALGIEVCTMNFHTHCWWPKDKNWKSSPMAPDPVHWEREVATVTFKYSLDNVVSGGCITTDYYYNEFIYRTTCKFTPGKEFYTSLEGTGEYNDEHENLTSVKTMITMESPTKMKQVQTYQTKHHKRSHIITVWREFSATGMKVTLQHPRMPHPWVRVYDKIPGPGKRKPKKQEWCREISPDYDS